MRKAGSGHILSITFVYRATAVIVGEFQYIGDRPQLWTSLFSIVVVTHLEALRKDRRWSYAALPALMLLWSNMHGGYILGDIIIVIYCMGGLLHRTLKKNFLIISIISVLLSGLNPKGFAAFLSVLPTFFDIEALQYWKSIVETQSIFGHADVAGIVRRLPAFSAIIMLSLLSFLLNVKNLKSMRIEMILLYILVFLMGLKAIRYIVFFACIASFISALNLKSFGEQLSSSRFLSSRVVIPRALTVILTALVAVALASQHGAAGIKYTGLIHEKPYTAQYDGAVNFVKGNHLRGNMFNDYNYGGYLIWWLSPDVRVFIDGRALDFKSFNIYRRVVDSPHAPASRHDRTDIYKRLFNNNFINLVMISGCDEVSGTVIQLTLALLKDSDWALVYGDRNALVFLRSLPQYERFVREYELPDTAAYDNILSMATAASRAGHGHIMPNWKLSLAIAFHGKREETKALYWVNEYLKFVPMDPSAMALRRKIEEGMK
jgi:hypothetical protein